MLNIFKAYQKLIIPLVVFSIICLPLLVLAQGLVPHCGGEGEPDCTLCHLLELAQNVLNFAIEMAFLIVVIFIVYGGLRWIFSGGKPENITTGQKLITNAIVGIVIILSAWLIVNTVFWFVYKIGVDPDYYSGTWYDIECQ